MLISLFFSSTVPVTYMVGSPWNFSGTDQHERDSQTRGDGGVLLDHIPAKKRFLGKIRI